MDLNEWWGRFRRSFGFWSLHCVVSALPGFCIAMWFLEFWKNPVAPLAMLAALFTFIVLTTCLSSLSGTILKWKTLPSRGLRVGLILRAICSGASFLILGVVLAADGRNGNPILMILPDAWTGLGAVLAVGQLSSPMGYGFTPADLLFGGGGNLGFSTIYLIALIDGLIISFFIFIASFVSMLVLQIRDRKKLYQKGAGYGLRDPAGEVGRLGIPQGKGKEAKEQA